MSSVGSMVRKPIVSGKVRPWPGLCFSVKDGPLHYMRSIGWENAYALVGKDRNRVELHDPDNARVFTVEEAAIEYLREMGILKADLWHYALGRYRLASILDAPRMQKKSLEAFCRGVMEWVARGGEGIFSRYAEASVGAWGGIDLCTAEGAVFWQKWMSENRITGENRLLLATREAEDYLMYAIDPRDRESRLSQYIDPSSGLLFSIKGIIGMHPVKREYVCRIGADKETVFNGTTIRWAKKTLPGSIGRWTMDVEGITFYSFLTHQKNAPLPHHEVRSQEGGLAAIFVGKKLGSSEERFGEISGRVKLKLVPAIAGHLGVRLRDKKTIHLPAAPLHKAGLKIGDEIEVSVEGPHIVAYHIPGVKISVKLVSHFNSKKKEWELIAAEPNRIYKRHLNGVVMIEGLRIVKCLKGNQLFAGINAGKKFYLWRVSSDKKFPRLPVSVILVDGKLAYFDFVERFPRRDKALLLQMGGALAIHQGVVDIQLPSIGKDKLLEERDAFIGSLGLNAIHADQKEEEAEKEPRVSFEELVAAQKPVIWEDRIAERAECFIKKFYALFETVSGNKVGTEKVSETAKLQATLEANWQRIEAFNATRSNFAKTFTRLLNIKTKIFPILIRGLGESRKSTKKL